MKKLIYIFMVFLLIGIIFANAHGEKDFTKAEELIKSRISCSELMQEQFEIIGDYYMEQMHPGELHEIMDERMGGEGSESLRLTHINIAKAFYCGEHGMMSAEMMNIVMGRSGSSMMENRVYYDNQDYNINNIVILIFAIITIVIIVLVVVLLTKQSKNTRRRKR